MTTSTSSSTDRKPFRLGFFSYLEGTQSATAIYNDVVKLFSAADELGFDMGWVAQHHFSHHGGLPSPFVFFSSVAARTRQIGFGTAVMTLPIEHPVRLAEEAAVFDTLHPDRLELGFGTGFGSNEVLDTFGVENRNRREVYDGTIERIQQAFAGKTLNNADDVLYPPAQQLNHHLWEAPSSDDRVTLVGERGNGLLLSRVAIGAGDRPTDEVQRSLVDHYKAALPAGVEPRIALSRSVYPSSKPDVAYNDLLKGLDESRVTRTKAGQTFPARSIEEEFDHFSIHWGDPERVIESLGQEPLLGEITDLICQVSPGTPSFAQTLDAIELLATRVAPALGWKPANR